MAAALLNQISDEFGGDALNRIASTIGESPGKIKTALGDILPAILGGLASKAQTKDGAHELLDVIHRDHLDTEQYRHVADAIKEPGALGNLMQTGGPLLDTVLGGKAGAVSDYVASHAGIAPAASKSLMSMVLPLVLGLLGRKVGMGGESGLSNLLGKPRTFLQDVPAGLAGIFSLGGAAGAARAVPSGVPYSGVPEATRPARKWLIPLLIVLGLGALIAYFAAKREPTVPPASTVSTPTQAVPFINKTLPGGIALSIPANGVENRLIAFIEDGSQAVSPDKWFSFDRLEFETGSATLKSSSQEQLRNVAGIMQAYPKVTLKIGGYTDNVGNPENNLQLSQQRAESAMRQLIALGVGAERLQAAGYGEQFPVADNSSEEGRQRNRRVDVNVTNK